MSFFRAKKWRRGRICAFAALTFFAVPATALDASRAVTQYVHASFGTEGGLPQSSVNAVAQTADGYLWIGTQDGLARFDGLRFKIFSNRDNDAFRDNFVSALFVDRAGTLWVGTDGGELLRHANGKFEALPALGHHSNSIRSIVETPDGALWVGSSGSGLHRLFDGKVTTYGKADGLPDDVVMAIATAEDGGVWVGTAGGLGRFHDGHGAAVGEASALGAITTLASGSDDTLWVGTLAGAVVQIRGGKIAHRIGPAEGLPEARIVVLRPDRDGSLWIGTEGKGVGRFRDGRLDMVGRGQGLTDDTAAALFEDQEGSIWIGTETGGLNVLKESRFVTWSSREGLSSDDVSSVLETRDGMLYFGTYKGGLNRLSREGVTAFTPKDGFPSEAVVGLTEDESGDLWIGSMRGPLFTYRQSRLTAVQMDLRLPNQGSRALYRDRAGVMWAGAPRGQLLRLAEGRWSAVPVPDVGTAILSLSGDSAGVLWVGTYSEGLRRRAPDGSWTAMTTADGLSNDMVLGFYEDAEGAMWISTHHGLNRYKHGRVKAITARDGLYHDTVYQTLEDDDGFFWMCSDRGISRTPKAELDAFADGRATHIGHRSFGLADGMKSVECNNGSPSGFKGRDGRLYFATMGGVVVVDPRATGRGRVPPVLLEQIVADGRVMDPADVELGPGLRNLEFQYATPSFVDPAHVSARYRLEGFDKDWVDAGLRRTAYYTNLPAGKYRFLVMACNADQLCSEKVAATSLMLLPRFRETRTFFGLCAAGSLVAIAFAWMGRTRQLRTRAAELEALVAQRTQQLKDANQRLESLAKVDELTRVANRRCFNAQLEVEWRRMRRNAKPLAVVLVDVDDFKAFNDHYGHLRGDECLIEVAEALQGAVGRPADLVARYGGEEFVLLLPETPEKGCRYVAERARAAVENLGIVHERSRTGGKVTISLGMAVVVPADGMSPQALIHAADEALYRAKRAGRNRAELATLG